MSTTFDFGFRDVLREFHGGARLHVLMAMVLHANVRNRCWPSMRGLAKETGYALAAVNEAKKWLEEHGAIEIVKYSERVNEEKEQNANHLQNVYQLTGVIKFNGKTYPVQYVGKGEQKDASNYDVPQNETSHIETSRNETLICGTEVVTSVKSFQEEKIVKGKKRKDSAPATADAHATDSNPSTSSLQGAKKSARTDKAPTRGKRAEDEQQPPSPTPSPTLRAKSVLQRVIDDQWQHPYTGTPAPADSHDGVWRVLLPQLMGTAAQKGRKEYNLSPAATEGEIYAFGKWYRRTNPDIPMPKSAEKLMLWFCQFRTCEDYGSRMQTAEREVGILYRGMGKPSQAPPESAAFDDMPSITSDHPAAQAFARLFPNEEQF